MSNPIYTIFCDQVCSVIRWKAARKPARAELTAHLEDHADVLTAQGVPPEVAARRAVEAMGDPGEDTQALLGSTAWLRITNPPPGARQFTVTLSSTQQCITLRITLEKEVPQP